MASTAGTVVHCASMRTLPGDEDSGPSVGARILDDAALGHFYLVAPPSGAAWRERYYCDFGVHIDQSYGGYESVEAYSLSPDRRSLSVKLDFERLPGLGRQYTFKFPEPISRECEALLTQLLGDETETMKDV